METVIRIPENDVMDQLGAGGERWTKHRWKNGSSMCLHGAIRACQPTPGDAYLLEQVAELHGWGPNWNDDEQTTWAMVRERIASLHVTDNDLAETFGPQWEQVVALVRRAATCTADEAQQLRIAHSRTRYDNVSANAVVDWTAARRVTDNLAYRGSACAAEAAFAAAWGAAGRGDFENFGLVGVAVEDAASALAARHLKGQHGFDQDHYNLLTAAWRTVYGPVHPDDPA